jgi:hypothetical protein
MNDHAASAAKQTVIAAPSIGAIALAWLDVSINTWSLRLGVAFLALQILYLARKWWREEFPRKEAS